MHLRAGKQFTGDDEAVFMSTFDQFLTTEFTFYTSFPSVTAHNHHTQNQHISLNKKILNFEAGVLKHDT